MVDSQAETTMPNSDGISSRLSSRPVSETLDRLEAVLRARGVTIFGRIDHSGEAKKVGLSLRPTQVLIFGNPKGGTGVMQAAPTSAIDLPLKALAWQDDDGQVWLSYNDPTYLARRFGLTDAQVAPLSGIAGLVEESLK
jgi:uncharacterized protein (DUF302 family)